MISFDLAKRLSPRLFLKTSKRITLKLWCLNATKKSHQKTWHKVKITDRPLLKQKSI